MPRPPMSQLFQDSLVVILLIVLIPSMISIMVISPVIHTETPYIIPGVTAAATVFTALVKNRIQHGLLRSLEAPLRRIKTRLQEQEGEPESSDSREASKLLQTLNTEWRGVLGIYDVSEISRIVPILLSYLPCALLMTAIVTTFTPTMSQRHVSYSPKITGPTYPFTLTGDTPACAGLAPKALPGPRHAFSWPLSNGSFFFGSYYGKDCAPTTALQHIPNINTASPDLYAYVDSGVAVHRTALGASAHLFRGPAVHYLDSVYNGRLRKTTQCVPVMVSNPVRCDKGGATLTRGRLPGHLVLRLDEDTDGIYNHTANLARDFDRDSGMANYLWANFTENDQPGNGGFVLSAYDAVVSDEVGFGRELARTIRDPDADAVTNPNSTYVVTCRINARDSFEYRRVTLAVQGGLTSENDGNDEADDTGVLATRINYNRILYGGDRCDPANETISYLHNVAAFTAHYKLSTDNFGLDGFFETVHRIAGGIRGPPYAFNNSRNGLEDALGVVSAIGVSNMIVSEEGSVVADAVDQKATAVIFVRQLGYGNLIVLLLVLPPLAALLTILYLYWMSFRVQHQPGGGVVTGGAGDGAAVYAAESLHQLVDLGLVGLPQNTCRKSSMADFDSFSYSKSDENGGDISP